MDRLSALLLRHLVLSNDPAASGKVSQWALWMDAVGLGGPASLAGLRATGQHEMELLTYVCGMSMLT